MCKKFYIVNQIDAISLKQSYVNFAPKELADETMRQIRSFNLDWQQITIGLIW